MNASVRTVYLSSPTPVAKLNELDNVALLSDVTDHDGNVIPAGTHGTVVAIWGEGVAYEVDFVEPIETNVTVEAEKLRPIDE